LSFIWIIFSPWLIGQHSFITIRSSRPSLSQVEKLEKLVKEYPDAYALDYLSHLQIQYKRTKQLQETVNLIDQVLPYYRELGYTKALLALMQRDVVKGKRMALAFQNKQDRYNQSNIFLLMGIAIDSNDYELFKTQIELFVRKLVFDLRLYYSMKASDVQIRFEALDLPFDFKDFPDGMVISWNEKLIKSIFNAGRSVRIRSAYSPKDRTNLINFLSFQFSRHDYFRLKRKNAYKDQGLKRVNQHMRDYFVLQKKIGDKSKEMSQKHQRILIKTQPFDRPGLQKKQQKEKQEALKPLQDELNKHVEFLTERTNWDSFMKKRSFVNRFVADLIKIIYPQIKQK
jgi:hypothetical protein